MSINRNNYEIYFLDYLDDNLNTHQVAELMIFLAKNPDLDNELNSIQNITIKPDLSVSFNNKNDLKKSEVNKLEIKENFENACIANFEGDLSNNEKIELQNYINNNPKNTNEYSIFSKLFLKADETIFFDYKASLKRLTINRNNSKNIFRYVSAAASVIVFALILNYTSDFADINNGFSNVSTKRSIRIKLYNNIPNPTIEKTDVLLAIDNNTVNNSIDNNATKSINKNNEYSSTINDDSKTNNKVVEIIENNSNLNNANIANNSHNINNTPKRKRKLFNSYNPKEIREIAKEFEQYKELTKSQEAKKLTFWDIADASLKGLSTITGKEVTVETKYDKFGKISNLAINSDSFEFSKKIKK